MAFKAKQLFILFPNFVTFPIALPILNAPFAFGYLFLWARKKKKINEYEIKLQNIVRRSFYQFSSDFTAEAVHFYFFVSLVLFCFKSEESNKNNVNIHISSHFVYSCFINRFLHFQQIEISSITISNTSIISFCIKQKYSEMFCCHFVFCVRLFVAVKWKTNLANTMEIHASQVNINKLSFLSTFVALLIGFYPNIWFIGIFLHYLRLQLVCHRFNATIKFEKKNALII